MKTIKNERHEIIMELTRLSVKFFNPEKCKEEFVYAQNWLVDFSDIAGIDGSKPKRFKYQVKIEDNKIIFSGDIKQAIGVLYRTGHLLENENKECLNYYQKTQNINKENEIPSTKKHHNKLSVQSLITILFPKKLALQDYTPLRNKPMVK